MNSFTFNHWILAARLKTLSTVFAPIFLISAFSYRFYSVDWVVFFTALLATFFIQVGTNFANDYYDYISGADSFREAGFKRATQSGLISPSHMKRAFILMFCCAFLSGIYLMYLGGPVIVLIGICSILFGYLYTGGPYPLGYHGLGDLTVFLFYGPVAVLGMQFLYISHITFSGFMLSLVPGFLSVGILVVNNLRDIESDKKANKLTLAVRFGKRFSQLEYCICLFFPLIISIGFMMVYKHYLYVFISIIPFLVFSTLFVRIFTARDSDLNHVLVDTSKLLFFQSTFLSLGLIL